MYTKIMEISYVYEGMNANAICQMFPEKDNNDKREKI